LTFSKLLTKYKLGFSLDESVVHILGV